MNRFVSAVFVVLILLALLQWSPKFEAKIAQVSQGSVAQETPTPTPSPTATPTPSPGPSPSGTPTPVPEPEPPTPTPTPAKPATGK